MIELSKEQQINVNPNPMIMKGGSVTFDVESTLPEKMLPKGTSYTLNFAYDGNDAVEEFEVTYRYQFFETNTTT